MQKFISSIVDQLITNNELVADLTIIMPSKRAGMFMKDALSQKMDGLSFLPTIISIEDFIQDLSEIQPLDSISLLFEFYAIYLKNTPKDKITDFDIFSNWASILIQDFNEIDRFLIDPSHLFSYINDINRIDDWFTNDNPQTELSKKYFSFFDYVSVYYQKFYQHLLHINKGYQGMQYREAYNNIDSYIKNNPQKKMTFIGFNALNKAEESIIQKLLFNQMTTIYFDIDAFFISEQLAPGNFITKYKKEWSYFANHPFNTISDDFVKAKEITIIGVPKNVSQLKEVGRLIKEKTGTLKNNDSIALVLANESLLGVAINSLPKTLKNANITMGYPLKSVALSNLFSLMFKMHLNKSKIGQQKNFYFRDVIAVLSHAQIKSLFLSVTKLDTEVITSAILKNNYTFIDLKKIASIHDNKCVHLFLELLFLDWNSSNNAIKACLNLLNEFQKRNNNAIETAYINHFKALFQQLENLNNTYNFMTTLDSLFQLYKQILQTESLAFKGDAKKGLQIMGMLETRVLDFETVILTSVNEGFLPAGKSNNSFIPFDVKRELGLPTYREKDAIFSYHFYRLLARAKTIYLLYNTEPDEYGSGEQSRFITQLEVLQDKLPQLTLTKKISSPKVAIEITDLMQIKKTNTIMKALKNQADKGFSPSSLTNYIYNPIAFYKQKIARISQLDDVEETVASNTLGNVIHRVLEDFYKPFKGKLLQVKDVLAMKKNSAESVKKHFEKEFINGDISKGKNLLIFEVAKQFINNFLNQEIHILKSGKRLRILEIEKTLTNLIHIEGIPFPIKLHGDVDRIDELDGVLRIIDYKTGKVEQGNLNIKDWSQLTVDYKKSKAFQVLMYAYMYAKNTKISFDDTSIESGVISFKNLKAGFIKVNKKRISDDDISQFEEQLKSLILEIYNKDLPFVENENLPY